MDFLINLENQSDKLLFWHLARRMRGRDICYCTATCIDRDFLECRIDYLKITNGITELRYCGDQLSGRDLLVSGNYVVLTFHTDWLLENKTGFEIFFAQEISSKVGKGNNFTVKAIYNIRGEIRLVLHKMRPK